MIENPAIFSASFASSEPVLRLWKGFLRRSQLGDVEFARVIGALKSRLEPLYK